MYRFIIGLHTWLLGGVWLTLLLPTASATAQMPYAAANWQTSILAVDHGFFVLDFAEAKVGLTFMENVSLGCRGTECAPDRLNIAFYTTAAARKGQRDMFSRLDFVPGYDLGARVAYVAARSRAGQHDVVFIGGSFSGQERDLFGFNPVTSVVTLSEQYQRTVAISAGYNHAFSSTTRFGVGFEGRREFSSPGAEQAREYCTPGTSPSGLRGLVCSDRFRAPLEDLWTGHVRTDATFGLTRLGSGNAHLALVSAASADFVQDTTVAANVSVGPSIMLDDHPGQPVVVLLIGLRDAFRAYALPVGDEQRGSFFADHVVFGLTVSAPFDALVSR